MTGVDPLPLEHYHEHWGLMPTPKFATPRDFTAPTLGPRQGAFARVWLRAPLLPFQQYIADVGGELRLNDAGIWVPRYTKCLITLQRQGGKSHMSMARNGERAFSRRNWRAWYTAQTGQDARDQFLKFHDEGIVGRPLEPVVKLNRSRGGESLTFANGSTMRPVPPTEEKLHGKQSDSTDIDEAWAFTKEEGEALVQAGAPTKLTRPHSQTWIWSAGGTPESTWLAELVAAGRAGEDPSMLIVEFGIPDDADAEDLDLIAAYHPAFGHTVTMDGLRTMRTDFGSDAAGWARAGGNRWSEIIGGAITAEQWKAIRWTDPVPDDARVGYGAARAADGSEVAIAAAVAIGDLVVVEVLDVLPTGYNAAAHVKGWAVDGPLAVAKNGASSSLAEGLAKAKTRNLLALTEQQAGAAVVNLLDSLPIRAIRFRPHPALDAAQLVAGTRPAGDGGKAWARVASGASIAALEAGTNAVWALTHGPAPLGKPRVLVARS